ncbi:Hypp5476 [Branchiostoma lanceolatum]|uniref:Hypp5476 protein n=1 Tax=Branchiostoma lanceolatum TaxID=7740 RepID=A0A8J9VD46_BRALA|nr:Hypp5476 [Branchiostoma lanceolatum]
MPENLLTEHILYPSAATSPLQPKPVTTSTLTNMAYKRLIELRESYQTYRAPTPPPNPDTVDEAIQRMERESRNLRHEATQDREVRRKRPQRPSMNNRNRYVRTSPTAEERDRALNEHSERINQRKMHLEMFGEDRSTSKLPSKRHSRTVRAPEKLHQLKQERPDKVPFNNEYHRHQMVRTTAMFGDHPTKKTSKTRRAPAQPSLVGVQGMMGEERRRYQTYHDEDEEIYITVEKCRPDRLKHATTTDLSSATKLPPLAPQHHHVTRKGTAGDGNTSASSMLRDPKPPAAAKSDISMATHPYRQKLPRRRTKDARALKRCYDDPSGPIDSGLTANRLQLTGPHSILHCSWGGEGLGRNNSTDRRHLALPDYSNLYPLHHLADMSTGALSLVLNDTPTRLVPLPLVLNDTPTRLVPLVLNDTPTRLVPLSLIDTPTRQVPLVLNDTPTRLVPLSLVLNDTPTRLVPLVLNDTLARLVPLSLNDTPTRLVPLSLVQNDKPARLVPLLLNDTPTRLVPLSLVLNDKPTRLVPLLLNDTPTRPIPLSLVLNRY